MNNTTVKITKYISCLVLCVLVFVDTVKAQEMTPLEISTMQTREYDITRRLAFDSSMGMFQDMGYIIENADWDTGLIKATQRGRDGSAFFKVNEQHQASIFIRSMGEKKVKIRINIRRQASGEKTFAGNAVSQGAAIGLGMLVPFGGILPSIADGVANENAKDDSVILNPEVYQAIFNKLENSLFITE